MNKFTDLKHSVLTLETHDGPVDAVVGGAAPGKGEHECLMVLDAFMTTESPEHSLCHVSFNGQRYSALLHVVRRTGKSFRAVLDTIVSDDDFWT